MGRVHTFIRIPAGAALAASVFGDASAAATLAAAILGGTLAAGSHFAKAGSRAVINTSPEPFSNWAASFGEDSPSAPCSGSRSRTRSRRWSCSALLVVLMIWLIPKVWRFVRAAASRRFVGAFGRDRRRRDAVPAAHEATADV